MKITRSHEQWRAILNEQQVSGLTIIDYCRKHQLATSSFYVFRKKLGITTSSFVRTQVVTIYAPKNLMVWCQLICTRHPSELRQIADSDSNRNLLETRFTIGYKSL